MGTCLFLPLPHGPPYYPPEGTLLLQHVVELTCYELLAKKEWGSDPALSLCPQAGYLTSLGLCVLRWNNVREASVRQFMRSIPCSAWYL